MQNQGNREDAPLNQAQQVALLDMAELPLSEAIKKAHRAARRTDHHAIPLQSDLYGFVEHPENIEGIGEPQVKQIHRVMFQHYLEDIRNKMVSEAKRREIWEWIFDTFRRWGEPVQSGTFHACCIVQDLTAMELIKSLVWRERDEVDRLFGKGIARATMRKADELLEVDEEYLCESMGGRPPFAPGCFHGHVPGGAL